MKAGRCNSVLIFIVSNDNQRSVTHQTGPTLPSVQISQDKAYMLGIVIREVHLVGSRFLERTSKCLPEPVRASTYDGLVDWPCFASDDNFGVCEEFVLVQLLARAENHVIY